MIDSLRIDRLRPPPVDPSNRFSDDPNAALLGQQLFHDPRFSANGQVSCATCHRAEYNFTDDLPAGKGVGMSSRRTMPLEGAAHMTWFFWDGRKDSLWAQILDPLESEEEHGMQREEIASLIDQHFRNEYEASIGPLPASKTLTDRKKATEVFVNVGKALAAFVRTLQPKASPFDRYAAGIIEGDTNGQDALSTDQQVGLQLFLTKAQCINCHNGPLFTNGEFHHVGTPGQGEPDRGRAGVIGKLLEDEFNCFSVWSDADEETECDHLHFLNDDPTMVEGAFKTPSLRNVAIRPPYMHAGQFKTLKQLLHHYREISGKNGVDEIFHNTLTDDELEQLEAFLHSLTSERQGGHPVLTFPFSI